MTRETYQESLRTLRLDVLDLGDLVVERLDRSLECLATGDEGLAQTVIVGDAEINEAYLALEDRCVDLFALQQPVAGDLRFVTATFKILTDLERIGDLATNLAAYATATGPVAASPAAGDAGTSQAGVSGLAVAFEDSLGAIGRDVSALVQRSLEAYEREDVQACREIAAADDAIDAACHDESVRVTRGLVEREVGDGGHGGDGGYPGDGGHGGNGGYPGDGDYPGDGNHHPVEGQIDAVSRVLLTIRDLERVADHAVNIAARTLYMVEQDPELIY